jgi:hypothetical protein
MRSHGRVIEVAVWKLIAAAPRDIGRPLLLFLALKTAKAQPLQA